jgi:hypothetical protein
MENEGSFVLVGGEYLDMVIARKAIHKGEDDTPNAVIDNLVDKGCGVIFLRIGFVKIPIIDAYLNGTLFLHDRNDIGYPFFKGMG